MIKKYNPVTPGLRTLVNIDRSSLSKVKPDKSLTSGYNYKVGRSAGSLSSRRRGGGHKNKYRLIDFKRNKYDVEGTIQTVEYDPNRSAFICLVLYEDKEKRYIIAPKGLKIGDKILSSEVAPIKPGNAMIIKNIPLGTNIHNIELKKGSGGELSRSAGTYSTLVAKEGNYVTIQLPSSEKRLIFKECFATVGEVSNSDHMNRRLGKAGRSRWLNKKPEVRGVVMNPVDHPHGGGEGKGKGRNPVTPWGVPTKGYKTRKKRNNTDKFIVSRRKKNRRK